MPAAASATNPLRLYTLPMSRMSRSLTIDSVAITQHASPLGADQYAYPRLTCLDLLEMISVISFTKTSICSGATLCFRLLAVVAAVNLESNSMPCLPSVSSSHRAKLPRATAVSACHDSC